MPFTHVVVDGSNIATEGRSIPSLAQLDEAVREFKSEFPQAEITVVVDATFGHRIDASERPTFDDAVAHGEMVSPPAGAIGRGDAFLLRIADRSGATVLSNDSFQEFHGEYDWLFTKDRLIGGKPVPAVGWIFTPRTPVRGPKSRESMREARKSKVRIGSKEASRPMPVPKAPPPRPGTGSGKPRKAGLTEAIAAATEEVVSPEAPGAGRRRRRRGSGPPPEAVNDPLTFIQFIADHPLGSEVEGDVDSFASHGAFVLVGEARCYIPLSAMGDPPPRSAREALNRGEKQTFVLQALDPQRRGIELALPGHAHVSGEPQPETVEAEISEQHARPTIADTGAPSGATPARRSPAKKSEAKTPGAKKATAPRRAVKTPSEPAVTKEPGTQANKAAATKSAVENAGPKKATVKRATAKKDATKKTTAKKTTAKKVTSPEKVLPEKATGKTGAVKKTAPAKTAAAKKDAAKKDAPKKDAPKKTTVKKAAVKKTTVKKAAVEKTTVKKTTAKKGAPSERAAPGKAPAKTAAAKKATVKKAAAKKTTAKKAPPTGL